MKNKFHILLFTLVSLFTSSYTLSQWVQQTIPVSKPITGIKFIDSLKGWACTDYGTLHDTCYILYTSNSGTNWVIQNRQYNTTFESLFMINGNTGYVGGYAFLPGPGTIIVKTTDGGLNWTIIPTGTSYGVTDMYFLNADSGYMCSSLFTNLYTTTNGGQNWTLRTTGINASVYRLFFLNYNTGYAGAASNLFKTTNAGLSWFQLSPFSSTAITAIHFLNENTGWLGTTNDKIYHTSNGGINWMQQDNPGFAGTIRDIYFFSPLVGYAGMSYITIYKTTDGGLNWGYQFDSSGSYRMSFVDSLTGWSGNTPGRNIISHTTNGGGLIFYTGFINISGIIPYKFILHQNYPNPFNPSTTIKLDVPKSSNINLVICDILGRELYVIANQYLTAGTYRFSWDARSYPSGIYFYRLTTENFAETKKMILLK